MKTLYYKITYTNPNDTKYPNFRYVITTKYTEQELTKAIYQLMKKKKIIIKIDEILVSRENIFDRDKVEQINKSIRDENFNLYYTLTHLLIN